MSIYTYVHIYIYIYMFMCIIRTLGVDHISIQTRLSYTLIVSILSKALQLCCLPCDSVAMPLASVDVVFVFKWLISIALGVRPHRLIQWLRAFLQAMIGYIIYYISYIYIYI